MNTRNESKSIEQKNEILLEYCNKMESLWECRKEFFKVFITGIQDDEVKNRIKIWYYQQHDQQVNPDIFTIVKVARQFKKEKDEDDKITLPDFENEEESE